MLTAGNSRVHSSCLAIDWDICTRSVVVFHLLSRVWLFMAPWTVAHQASLSSTISCSSNSCPLSQRCHPTISSSASLLSFCLQSFPASGNIICTCICTLYVHVKKNLNPLLYYFKLMLPKFSIIFYDAMHFWGIHLLQCLPLYVKPTHFALHLSLAVLALTSWTFPDAQLFCLIILN